MLQVGLPKLSIWWPIYRLTSLDVDIVYGELGCSWRQPYAAANPVVNPLGRIQFNVLRVPAAFDRKHEIEPRDLHRT